MLLGQLVVLFAVVWKWVWARVMAHCSKRWLWWVAVADVAVLVVFPVLVAVAAVAVAAVAVLVVFPVLVAVAAVAVAAVLVEVVAEVEEYRGV